MATTNTFNRLKTAFDLLGITLEPVEGTELHQFEYESFPFYLSHNEGARSFFLFVDVIDANGNLTEEAFNDTIEIVAEYHPSTCGQWRDGEPIFYTQPHQLPPRAKLKPEVLELMLEDFHEAVLFMQGNLFIMTDDYFSSLIG